MYTQAHSLKDLINKFLENNPSQQQLTAARIRFSWHKVMPKVVSDRTEKITIQQHTLYVTITSAPLRQELQLNKAHVMALLKDDIPYFSIEKIIFL